MNQPTHESKSEPIRAAVRNGYSHVAKSGLSSHQTGIQNIARAFGYSEAELSSIPAEANMGLSCGNPVAMASLQPGETVVDLGSGGGLDVFLAAQKVGPTGHAIGIDMTAAMVDLARKNAAKSGIAGVKFYLAEIEAMPLSDNSVDCVISNCVLNLCPDKDAALREIYRILKPGGRLAISDIALKQTLPEAIAREVAAWTGCIAGALTIESNREKLENAGFGAIAIQDAGSDLNAYRDGGHAACCGPESSGDMRDKASAATQASACCAPAPAGSEACCAPPTAPQAASVPAAKATVTSKARPKTDGCCAPSPVGSSACCEPAVEATPYHETMGELLDRFDVNAYAASVKIFALKPR